jgi:hypothetical protein
MRTNDIIEIIERRKRERYETMRKYERGSAHDRACAARHELIDLLIEIEHTEEEQKEQRRQRRRTTT